MIKYKLGDVVKVISERVDNPANCEYDKFVGLEHYVSGEIEIKKYGNTSLLKSAMKVFKSGDILIARRNVYLKRASIVKFDGITSGDSIVLRVEDKLLRRIIPFVLNTDEFWGYAEKFSDGTMSKRLSPKVLLEYEFMLPQIAQQEKLVDLLWAANNTKEAYKKLLYLTDELIKSQFIEVFGDPKTNPMKWELRSIDSLTKVVTGATPNRNRTDYYSGSVPWVKTGEISKVYITEAEESITELAITETNCKVLPIDTIMLAMYGQGKTRGQSGILKIAAATNQACAAILPSDGYHPMYLLQYLTVQYDSLRAMGRGAQQSNLNLSMVKNYKIMYPPIILQNRFADFVKQSDKSKLELKQNLDNLETTIKALMSKNFG